MSYRRLTQKDRYQIEAYLQSGMQASDIARRLQVHPSTISRELRRSSGSYNADVAVAAAQKLSSSRRKDKFYLRGSMKKYVEEKLRLDWSPEQIVGRRLLLEKPTVSHQTIYRYVARLKLQGSSLWKHLRILKKERKERSLTNFRTLPDPRNDRVHISERPKIVDKRKRTGDVERDTVFGKKNGAMLLTIVDRVSRKSWIELVDEKCSVKVHEATVRALKNETIHTITNDNGTEFAQHQATAKALEASVYFSRAYCSSDRGTNENTNGLIRQYCPRRASMEHLKPSDIRFIENRLNNRPRKVLGFKTPNEVHESA